MHPQKNEVTSNIPVCRTLQGFERHLKVVIDIRVK
jgi:hypothetical protein